jgi:hypothetical protein
MPALRRCPCASLRCLPRLVHGVRSQSMPAVRIADRRGGACGIGPCLPCAEWPRRAMRCLPWDAESWDSCPSERCLPKHARPIDALPNLPCSPQSTDPCGAMPAMNNPDCPFHVGPCLPDRTWPQRSSRSIPILPCQWLMGHAPHACRDLPIRILPGASPTTRCLPCEAREVQTSSRLTCHSIERQSTGCHSYRACVAIPIDAHRVRPQ